MKENRISIKCRAVSPKIGREIPLPAYATNGSAGMDLHACLDGPLYLPGAGGEGSNAALVPTGIAIQLPGAGYVALVCARSGLAVKHGVTLSNGVGVIDSDYRGEIKVALVNLSREGYTIEPGERIAQLLILPVAQAGVELTGELEDTARGAGGFGSTGRT